MFVCVWKDFKGWEEFYWYPVKKVFMLKIVRVEVSGEGKGGGSNGEEKVLYSGYRIQWNDSWGKQRTINKTIIDFLCKNHIKVWWWITLRIKQKDNLVVSITYRLHHKLTFHHIAYIG